jgi:hypothetical protein
MIPPSQNPLIQTRLYRLKNVEAKSIGAIAVACVTALGFASAYLQQFFLPSAPLAPWGDQVMWLQNGIRILSGQLPYRDYFQLTTPGCDLFYALTVHFWGARAWIPNLTMAILGAGIALGVTLIARRVVAGVAMIFPALLFAGLTLPSSLYATHHWFSTLGVLIAMLVLLDEVTIPRAAAAGALCGLAGCFTQTKAAIVAVAMLSFFFLRRSTPKFRRQVWLECAAFCSGFVAVLAAVNAYFIRAAGPANFLLWTIVFPVRYFSAAKPFNTLRIYGNGFGPGLGLLHEVGFLFVHALVPLMYVVFFIQLLRRQIAPGKRDAMLLIALTGLAMFLAIAPAPSPLRIFTVSPPAFILLVIWARENRIANILTAGLAALALCVSVLAPIRFQTHRHAFLDTPSGRVAFDQRDRLEEFQWALAKTYPGETFFGNPPVCFALGLNNPTPLNFTTPDDFTRPSQVAEVVRDLERTKVPLILLLPDGYLPRTHDHATDHMEPFREYLYKNYDLERRFATGDEAWTRRSFGPESGCTTPDNLDSRDKASDRRPSR